MRKLITCFVLLAALGSAVRTAPSTPCSTCTIIALPLVVQTPAYLTFAADTGGGSWGLYTIASNGNQQQKLLDGAVTHPVWAPGCCYTSGVGARW